MFLLISKPFVMTKEFKIYTKTGDAGTTSLIGGKRVSKYHPRIEAYGTVDELNSFIGAILDHPLDGAIRESLDIIQERLFTLEAQLARDPQGSAGPLPEIVEGDVTRLEGEIDRMNEGLPELRSFIIPGGHPAVSSSHIARTVCRRAERVTLRLSENEPVAPVNLKYLNRLSDYLFVLSRRLAHDNGVDEKLWKTNK